MGNEKKKIELMQELYSCVENPNSDTNYNAVVRKRKYALKDVFAYLKESENEKVRFSKTEIEFHYFLEKDNSEINPSLNELMTFITRKVVSAEIVETCETEKNCYISRKITYTLKVR